jgi:anti-sigma factor RsiW
MNPARDTSGCQRFERWITAYVDDELDAVHMLEVEDHIDGCDGCRDWVSMLRATRASLRRQCHVRAPSALRARMTLALRPRGDAEGRHVSGVRARNAAQSEGAQSDAAQSDAAQSEGTQSDGEGPPPPAVESRTLSARALASASTGRSAETVEPGASVHPVRPAQPAGISRYRFIMPVAAAATIALVLGVMQLQERETEVTSLPDPSAVPTSQRVVAALDSMVEELVSQHAQPPPLELSDPDNLQRFEPYVGVRVRNPTFQQRDMHFVGARLINHRRAALLQHSLKGRRVTMYVFNPDAVPMRSDCLQPQRFGSTRVFVGRVRGYSVAASERDGIGYALASDQDSAQLLVAAR